MPDKGSVVVVWRVDLYQKEAYGNFLAPPFMQKLKKDLTIIHEKIVKNTINNLIAKQEFPKISPSSLLELRVFTFYPKSTNLTTQIDPSSLSAVVPTGLLSLKHFFDQRTVKEPSLETLLRLTELVLTLNYFSFGGKYYKQTNGVVMGTKIRPDYAIPYSQYNGPKPEFNGR